MENNPPRGVKIIAFLNYAGALSALVILWTILFNPSGSFLEFNDALQNLFLGAAGSFLAMLHFGIGFFGGSIYFYLIPLVLYCVLLFFLAEQLLKGKKWARIIQLIGSTIAVFSLFGNVVLYVNMGEISLIVISVFNFLVSIGIVVYLFSRKVKDFFKAGPQQISHQLRIRILLFTIIYIIVATFILYLFVIVYQQSQWYLNRESEAHAHPKQEMVMTKGMEITAQTPRGTIKIFAPNSFTRTYSWDNCVRTQTLWPRGEKRWYGSFGAYFAGPNPSWKDCNGINGAVLEEGQQHFSNPNKAMAWINSSFGSDHTDIVYNNQGLLIYFSKEPSTFQAQVWQITIDGAKPSQLPGSNDDKISVKKRIKGGATKAKTNRE